MADDERIESSSTVTAPAQTVRWKAEEYACRTPNR